MLHRHILHNHQIYSASDRLLAPCQAGLLTGWGVFSTLRVTDGVLFAFERHWARIARDAARLHVPLPCDADTARRSLLRLVAANDAQESTLRVAILRNTGGMWSVPLEGAPPSDLIALTADTKAWHRGVKLDYVVQARHAACEFTGAKSLSWAANLVWLEEAQTRGFDEVVLLNERGEVAECTSANIFIAVGNTVYTPPLDSGCLPGVTRELLLEEIRVPGYPVIEKTLLPADLEAADEVFITSTTRDLLPVGEIAGKPVGRADAARAALSHAFGEYNNWYVSQHQGK